MKQTIAWIALLVVSCISASGQKIEKPTLTPKPCTPAQELLIREGVTFHDAKKFPLAVEKYEKVLAENPDCTVALYELSMTYYAMGEKTKAMESAYKGSKYKSDELALFYLTMANVIDDVGKPEEAIRIYRDAIKMLEGEKDSGGALSSLHYNLGVTYTKQKKYPEARIELKKAVEYNYSYASPHFLLSVIFRETRYKIPAFATAARFLSLELTSPRSQTAGRIVADVLKPAPKNEKTGNIMIVIDPDAPKDEGDFLGIEMLLGTLNGLKGEADKNLSDEQRFVSSVETLIALIVENKDIRSKFIGKYYVAFLAELKKQGHAPALSYLALHHSGNEKARQWISSNESKMRDFIAWAKAYPQAR